MKGFKDLEFVDLKNLVSDVMVPPLVGSPKIKMPMFLFMLII